MKLTKEQFEAEIQKQMKANRCTYEEAKEIVEWDYEIDHGNKELGALSSEQKKMIRKLHKADKDPTKTATRKPRERKVDEEKHEIFSWFHIVLEGMQLNGKAQIAEVKPDSKVSFMVNGNCYTLTLTKHRAEKA